jgi:hypothetical protein
LVRVRREEYRVWDPRRIGLEVTRGRTLRQGGNAAWWCGTRVRRAPASQSARVQLGLEGRRSTPV